MVAACLGGGLLATEAGPHVMMMLLQSLGIVVRIVAGVRLLGIAWAVDAMTCGFSEPSVQEMALQTEFDMYS